jgi:oligopeptide transport system substrate-binding protein
MAERWETSADGLTWRFYLREASWSDGTPVTADDFVFAVRRIMNPETASEYASLLYVIKGAQAVNEGKAAPETIGVRALGPRTLEYTLNNPAPFLPELATHYTMYPVPKHIVEKNPDGWVQPGKYVANGPYTLAENRLGDYVRLVKNPRFYDAKSVCLTSCTSIPPRWRDRGRAADHARQLHFHNDIQSNRIAFLRKPDQIPRVRADRGRGWSQLPGRSTRRARVPGRAGAACASMASTGSSITNGRAPGGNCRRTRSTAARRGDYRAG